MHSEAVSELINLKARIEQESSELMEERSKLTEKLKLIRLEKESQRANNVDIYQKLIQARLDSLAAKRRVENLACHVAWQRQENDTCDSSIMDIVKMPEFAKSIEQLRSSIESAVNFYSEDSLQMELMKRNATNREMRVELTRITQELQQRKKELEAELEEKKRIEQAKLERQKQEDERKRLIAEEKARMAARYQPPVQASDLTLKSSFRSVTFSSRSPELSYRQQSFSADGTLSPEDDGRVSNEPGPKGKLDSAPLPSFSQLTRGW